MKITIRKKDSVTSIVLFILNILGELKNEYSIDLCYLLDLMQYFNKSEVSVRTGLSRMVKANILINSKENNETVYELTENGLQAIQFWNKALSRYFMRLQLRKKDWNKNWNLLTINDFNKSEYENLTVVEELKECGLREINNNTWITPNLIDNELLTLINNKRFNYLIFSGTFNSNIELDQLLNKTFEINILKDRYIKFIAKIENNKDKLNIENPKYLLPIIFEVGWEFYDIVTTDAVLPKDLLNEWEGDRAAYEMKEFRSKIVSRINAIL